MSSSSDETSLADSGAPKASSSSRTGWLSSTTSDPAGHIPLGTVLADRYRVIGLLGRGGMGEVYRADDLRLGQTVALKFLPRALNDDAARLAQFHNEVRVARQVSHRNVCRVYDIGEAEGRIFLTMEYVDGEDLATLLRRIGRLPQDKGVEVARQICAGLAAAHDQGVLHRDLKPANVMLDGQGHVRITDFGLAGLAADINDIRSGTPAYMAPEQLAGKEVSVRSDVFSLGLTLYEIFTGKRAFDAKTVAELLRMHDEGLHVTPTSAVRDLEPVIERVIERCLQADPAKRPPSALAVAAALPGGDPLAAALAAGETPSLEMVAAAGDIEAVPLHYGLPVLGFILVALVLLVAFGGRVSYVEWLPLDKAPDVLADRALSVRTTLGYGEAPADQTGGFSQDGDFARWSRQNKPAAERWKTLQTGRHPPLFYWYRTSPRPIVPNPSMTWPTAATDPPLAEWGMTLTQLDTRGRLVQFDAVPPQKDAPAAAAPDAAAPAANWDPLFTLAELPRDRFTPAAPEWIPRLYADTRVAWVGTVPELGATPLRVEAASYRGRVTYFQLIGPWTRAGRMEPIQRDTQQRIFATAQVVIVIGGLVGAALLARRNFVLGRGDRAGGRRVAAVMLAASLLSWALEARHYGDLNVELGRFFVGGLSDALFSAALFWVIYIAVEPWIRRHWPDCLVGWTRLTSRGFHDALVGRDILFGLACGIALFGYQHLSRLIRANIGDGVLEPLFGQHNGLEGLRYIISDAFESLVNAPVNAVFFVLAYVVLLRLLRFRMAAAVGFVMVFNVFIGNEGAFIGAGALDIVLVIGYSAIVVATLLRLGLLAFMVMMFTNNLLYRAPWTPDVSAWYATSMLVVVSLTAVMAIFAFVQSRSGAPLFGKGLLEE